MNFNNNNNNNNNNNIERKEIKSHIEISIKY